MASISTFTSICLLLSCLISGATSEEEDKGPILFSPNLTHKYVFADSNLFVTCYARPGTNAVRLMWKNPTKEITKKTGRIHVEESSVILGGVDIILEKVTMSDQGRYHCSAIVDGHEVSKFFELLVFMRVVFVDTPPIQYAPEKSNHLIRCDASGHPSPNITWQRVNGTITGDKFVEKSEGLVIRNVTKEDAGVYICRGSLMTEHISDLNVMEIKVIVQYKPEWQPNQPNEMYSFIDGSVNLTCEAEGEPTPTYTWFQDSYPITSNVEKRIITDENKTILEITVDSEDFTNYTCVATNELGAIHRTIVLKEGVKPGIPRVKKVDSQGDKLILKIDPPSAQDLYIIGYNVQYKKEGENWEDDEIIYFSIDESEYVLENLNQDTEYVIRVQAVNEAGIGDFTDEVLKKTQLLKASLMTRNVNASSSHWYTAVGFLDIILLLCLTIGL